MTQSIVNDTVTTYISVDEMSNEFKDYIPYDGEIIIETINDTSVNLTTKSSDFKKIGDSIKKWSELPFYE